MNISQYKHKQKEPREQYTEISNPHIQENSYIQNGKYYQNKQKCLLPDSSLNYMHNNQSQWTN